MAPRRPRRALTPLLALLAVALIAAACGGDSAADAAADADAVAPAGRTFQLEESSQLGESRVTGGSPRPYALGFAAVPVSLSEQAYERVFDVAAQQGDLIMIQRAVPWAELAPGADLLPQTEATIERERELLAGRGLELLFAIDPWEPTDRGVLAGDAPGAGFADPAVADAFVAYAELVAERYRPRWLALAVDLDQFAQARPNDVAAFKDAYVEAYKRVKEIAPGTLVFAIFQLEDLQGLLPWGAPHPPQWALILQLKPFLDVLAVSSFPSFIFPFADDIPPQYYSRLLAFGKPLALAPTGFASEPGRGGVTFGAAVGQRRFVERLLAEAEAARWAFLVWLAPQDPRFAVAAPFDLVSRMGLRDRDGRAKPAWMVWTDQARRPWTPPPLAEAPPANGDEAEASPNEPG